MQTQWFKSCPKCNKILYFVSQKNLNGSINKNKLCRSCNQLGHTHGFQKNHSSYNFKDLTGCVFGRLQVLKRAEGSISRPEWICKCDPLHGGCGKETIVKRGVLQQGKAKSCGCLLKDSNINRHPPFTAPYNSMASEDKKRNRECMTYDEFLTFTSSKTCHYCGEILVWKSRGRRRWNIDRKDSNIGHTKENCVPCCKICNRMKMNLPYSQFINQCQKISKSQLLSASALEATAFLGSIEQAVSGNVPGSK